MKRTFSEIGRSLSIKRGERERGGGGGEEIGGGGAWWERERMRKCERGGG